MRLLTEVMGRQRRCHRRSMPQARAGVDITEEAR